MSGWIQPLERVYRRVLGAIGRGRVTLVDDSKGAQMMQLRLGADDIKDGTPHIAEYGFTSVPPIGSDAVVLFIHGERAKAVVIATNNQDARMKNLQPGDVAVHDNRGRYVRFTAAGIFVEGGTSVIDVHTGGSVLVDAGGDIVTSGAGRAIVNNASAFFNCPVTFTQAVTFTSTVTIAGKDIGSHTHTGGTISGNTGGMR